MGDAWRLAVGTLTAVRVPAPRVVDRTVGGRAMLLAPLVGLALGIVAAAVGLAGDQLGLSPLVVAVLVVALLALLTRGLHLDGLADTADGLGSGRRGDEALAVMSRSDIGPFGVVTLMLVLLVDVAALTQLWTVDRTIVAVAVVVAAVASRAALPLLCRRSLPAAKQTGLGSSVASSVSSGALLAVLLGTLALVAMTAVVGVAFAESSPAAIWQSVVAAAVALAVVALLARRCVSRFGGVTGDVLGAGVELAFAATLLGLAVLA